jgi:hypothetical protein
VSGQLQAPAALTPGVKSPGINRTGGWSERGPEKKIRPKPGIEFRSSSLWPLLTTSNINTTMGFGLYGILYPCSNGHGKVHGGKHLLD